MVLGHILDNSILKMSIKEIDAIYTSIEEKLYEEYWLVTRKQDYSSANLADLQINLQRLKILLRNYDKLNKAFIVKADGLILFSNKLDTFERLEAFDRITKSKNYSNKYKSIEIIEC